jgi:tetratricopeptide (TPR) repeat protein
MRLGCGSHYREAMRRDVAMTETRTVLDELISRWHLTRDAAAKLVVAAGCPVTGRHLGGIARGHRHAGARLAASIEKAFGLPLPELLAPYEAQWLPSAPPHPNASPTGCITTEEAFALATERAYQYKLAYQTRIDTSALADDVRHLAQAYPQQALTEVISPLVATQQAIYEQLEHGTVHTASARELHFLAGITTGMIAKAAHDSGDADRAVELARSAAMAAELAGHTGLQAWVSGLLSLITYWAGRPQESIRHAQRAAHLSAGTTSTVTVWAAVSQARAWAKLRNPASVETALANADSAQEHATGDDLDVFGGLLTFPRARALYYTAEASATAGLTTAAVQYGQDAVEAYRDQSSDHWAFGDAAGASAALATAYIQQGEVEGASELLVPVLDLPPTQRTNGIIKCVEPVYDAITATDTGDAGRVLSEQIEAFNRVPMRAVSR